MYRLRGTACAGVVLPLLPLLLLLLPCMGTLAAPCSPARLHHPLPALCPSLCRSCVLATCWANCWIQSRPLMPYMSAQASSCCCCLQAVCTLHLWRMLYLQHTALLPAVIEPAARRLLLPAAASALPDVLVRSLKAGGRMVCPVGPQWDYQVGGAG